MELQLYKDGKESSASIPLDALNADYPPSIHLDQFVGYKAAMRTADESLLFGCKIFETCLQNNFAKELQCRNLKIMLSYDIGSTNKIEIWSSNKFLNVITEPFLSSELLLLIVTRKNFFYLFVESYSLPIDFSKYSSLFGAMYTCSKSIADSNDEHSFVKHITLFRLSDM